MKSCSLKEGMGGVCSQDAPEMLFSSHFLSVLHSPKRCTFTCWVHICKLLYRADGAIPSQISCSGICRVGLHNKFKPKRKKPIKFHSPAVFATTSFSWKFITILCSSKYGGFSPHPCSVHWERTGS